MKLLLLLILTMLGGLIYALYPQTEVAKASTNPIKALAQHTKDPAECKKVCAPPGYDGEWPEEYPDDVRKVTCNGEFCAKAGDGHEPKENEDCKAHYSCDVFCSEICCQCLATCL